MYNNSYIKSCRAFRKLLALFELGKPKIFS